MDKVKMDICVIGAGSGGLSVAAGAAQMGASVILIEKDRMGGDCLNTGCVPSKALLASAKRANAFRDAPDFGIATQEPNIDFERIHKHVHNVINRIAPNDSVERFESLGVKVLRATATFKDNKTILAGNCEIQARRIVVATGSRAVIPPILGLDKIPYLTNETIFDLTECPEHLIIIGGGPIGCEMGEAYRLLGAKVTILEQAKILPKDEPELVDILRQRLIEHGIDLFEDSQVIRTEKADDGSLHVHIEKNGKPLLIKGSHILAATGRQTNIDLLNLENASVEFTQRGITTDNRLRSVSNKRVFAIGDVAGNYQFTHAANYHAGIALRNILFALPAKANYSALPWVTYTELELAHVGLTESDAKAQGIKHKVFFWSFEENDRAQAEHATDGKMKLITGPKGAILGCSIIGKSAGELILPWCLAIQEKLKISSMARVIAPYPTLSEASKRLAGSYYTKALFSNKTKQVVRWIQRLLP
jgi:pyruvate/2-oxoglutarate dehydrogenase complex dihydrolipoamide dehydrogenase (E3) component